MTNFSEKDIIKLGELVADRLFRRVTEAVSPEVLGSILANPDYLFEHLDQDQAAKFKKCSTAKLEKDRVQGGGPKFISISGRMVRYRRLELIQHSEERLVASTTETPSCADYGKAKERVGERRTANKTGD